MNIEKVKEALGLALREHNDFMSQADLPIGSKKIEEALAELEKPAEDFLFNRYDPTTNEWDSPEMYESKTGEYVSYDDAIKYAESYHVKKCAECADRSAPRFPESRSGVTTDVDK